MYHLQNVLSFVSFRQSKFRVRVMMIIPYLLGLHSEGQWHQATEKLQ